MTENITTQDSIRALLAPSYIDSDASREVQERFLAQQAEIVRLKAQVDDVLNQRDNIHSEREQAVRRAQEITRNLEAFKNQVAEALQEFEQETGANVDDLFETLGLERPTKEVELVVNVQITVTLTVPSNVDVDDLHDDFSVDDDGQVLYSGDYETDMQAQIDSIQEN